MRNNNLDLKLKYRPENFSEIIGNEDLVTSLVSVLHRKEGIPHSFLFAGPKGCGKSTLSKLVAKELGCPDHSITIYNIGNQRGIDDARNMLETLNFAPLGSKIRIIILEECHRGNKGFWDCLLVKLESPPSHIFFILCTTAPEELPGTIRDRCHIYNVNKLIKPKIIKLLKWICKEEKIEVSDALLDKIASCSDGTPRIALTLLDKIIDVADDDTAFRIIESQDINEKSIIDLCNILLKPNSKWSDISKVIKLISDDPEKIRHYIGTVMSNKLLVEENPTAGIILDFLANTNFMYIGKWGLTSVIYNIFCSIKK